MGAVRKQRLDGVEMIKYPLLIALIVSLFAAATAAQNNKKARASEQTNEAELIELERQLSEALARQDAKVLDHLWSETLVFTTPNGQISNKAKRLAAQRPSPDANQMTNRNEDVKVYFYGDTAVVTVRSRWEGKVGTQQFSDPYQATHVWIRRRGRWQLVAAHVSHLT